MQLRILTKGSGVRSFPAMVRHYSRLAEREFILPKISPGEIPPPGALRGMSHKRRRGFVLLVVLGVLCILSLLATAFATLCAVERATSRNFADAVRAL